MIDILIRELDNRDLDNDNTLAISHIKYHDNNMVLTMELTSDFEPDEDPQVWELTCHGLHEHTIESNFATAFVLSDNHPLLWELHEEIIELYFKKKPDDVYSLIGELYSEHQQLTGGWIQFQQYFNVLSYELLANGYGLLAKGPKPLIKCYSEVLSRHGVKCNTLHTGPKPWVLNSWAGEGKDYKVLLLGGSYIIAKEFAVVKTR